MDKYNKHLQLCHKLNDIYVEKNKAYGDSFGISVQKYGFISALTRMSDKFNRIESLILNAKTGANDESLIDSLEDLANYCLMTVMELEKDFKNGIEGCSDEVLE